MPNYQIHWMSKDGSTQGHGDAFPDRENLDLWVTELNKKYHGIIHWVVESQGVKSCQNSPSSKK